MRSCSSTLKGALEVVFYLRNQQNCTLSRQVLFLHLVILTALLAFGERFDQAKMSFDEIEVVNGIRKWFETATVLDKQMLWDKLGLLGLAAHSDIDAFINNVLPIMEDNKCQSIEDAVKDLVLPGECDPVELDYVHCLVALV